MNQISLIPSDVAELARRRGLPPRGEPAKPSGRCCSVSSSGWNGKPAILRGWIAQWEADVEVSPEMRRMVDWVKAELAGLEEFLNPSRLSQLLQTRNLFPKDDDLFDPLGEPPPKRPLGR